MPKSSAKLRYELDETRKISSEARTKTKESEEPIAGVQAYIDQQRTHWALRVYPL
jgi:hypothetical protein